MLIYSFLCTLFAVDMVSDKTHLIENSLGLIFCPLIPLNFGHMYLTAKVERKPEFGVCCAACHLDLKITFLCLRSGLNFNLQTLVCICDRLGLLPCGLQAHITKAQTHTAA